MASSSIAPNDLARQIDDLHQRVRRGLFRDSLNLAEACWQSREALPPSSVHRLRSYTLAWEINDTLGHYAKAEEYLRSDDIAEVCLDQLRQAVSTPKRFIAEYVSNAKSDLERKGEYQRWRQRTMVVMAWGLATYRLQLFPSAKKALLLAKQFVDSCLLPVGYSCSGTRSRLHIFLGQVYQRQRQFDLAAREFDESLRFCYARLDERLRRYGVQGEAPDLKKVEAEKSFATYRLGTLLVKMAELEFDQGRIKTAKRYLQSAIVLLRESPDSFLVNCAQLLSCEIARMERAFTQQGWKLLDRFHECTEGLSDHPEYSLDARIEEITTAVYLHHAKNVPGRSPTDRLTSTAVALDEINRVLDEAVKANFQQTQFHALLVKARICNRLANPNGAHDAIDRAIGLYGNNPPSPFAAEALFVRGRTYEANEEHTLALQTFQKAFDLGHESRLFRAACQLHILEELLQLNRVDDARKSHALCTELLTGLEAEFLIDRFKKLSALYHRAHMRSFNFEQSGFDIRAATADLERAYIDFLAGLVGSTPRDLVNRKKPRLINKLQKAFGVPAKRELITQLVRRHYPARVPGRVDLRKI